MAPSVTLLAAAGALAGVCTGLIPGLHANTVALVAGAAVGGNPNLPLAAGLVAASVSHTFVSVVPATFLGAPTADAAASTLPAHELLHEGRGPEAVHLSARGSAWGLAAGLVAGLPLALAVGPPVRLVPRIQGLRPVLLAGIVLLLLARETGAVPYRRVAEIEPGGPRHVQGVVAGREDGALVLEDGRRLRDPLDWAEEARPGEELDLEVRHVRRTGPLSRPLAVLAAAGILALSGLLGFVALTAGARSPLGLPGSALFPTLTGLFGVPALGLAARADEPPRQAAYAATTTLREEAGPSLRGAGFGTLVGLLPGVTAAHATALALSASGHPDREIARERTLLALSATNTAGAVLAFAVFAGSGPARSGVLATVASGWTPPQWAGLVPPPGVLRLAAAMALGGLVGYPATRRAGDAYGRLLRRLPARGLSALVIAGLAILAWAFTGLLGLALLVAGTAVGVLPWVVGVRRSHAMGVILLPVLWWSLPG